MAGHATDTVGMADQLSTHHDQIKDDLLASRTSIAVKRTDRTRLNDASLVYLLSRIVYGTMTGYMYF